MYFTVHQRVEISIMIDVINMTNINHRHQIRSDLVRTVVAEINTIRGGKIILNYLSAR